MSLLAQMRTGYELLIKFNPSVAKRWVYPMKDNGLGVMIPDLDKQPEIKMEAVRLSHESGSVPTNAVGVTGLSTNASCFLNLYHDSQLEEGNIIGIDGQGWKVGHVEPAKAEGETYGKHCPLFKANLSGDNEIESVTIDDVEGVIDGQTITVTLPAGTDVTALEPVIAHTGKIISPTGVQDFTEPVDYTITAEDFKTNLYQIVVEVEE